MSSVKKTKHGNEGIARGYRLKPETHELVSLLQKKINGTKNDVISRACELFYVELTAKRINIINISDKRINNNINGEPEK
jgi:hypothetical protein